MANKGTDPISSLLDPSDIIAEASPDILSCGAEVTWLPTGNGINSPRCLLHSAVYSTGIA